MTFSTAFKAPHGDPLPLLQPVWTAPPPRAGYFYLRSLPLKGTTWIPRGPPSFVTSTSLTMSLGDGDGWKTERQVGSGWVGGVGGVGGWKGKERRGVTPCGGKKKQKQEVRWRRKETTWWQQQQQQNGGNKIQWESKKRGLEETGSKKQYK